MQKQSIYITIRNTLQQKTETKKNISGQDFRQPDGQIDRRTDDPHMQKQTNMYLKGILCLIILTHYNETTNRDHDAQIVRAKENLKLSHCRALGNTQRMKALH